MPDLSLKRVESETRDGKWWIEATVIGYVGYDEMNDFPTKLHESIRDFCKASGAHEKPVEL